MNNVVFYNIVWLGFGMHVPLKKIQVYGDMLLLKNFDFGMCENTYVVTTCLQKKKGILF
jgi:hypothetical protein